MKILATTYDPYFNPEDFDIYDALIPYIGSYAAALGGVDVIVFTAGVGENGIKFREQVMEGLGFIGTIDKDKNDNFVRGEVNLISTPNSKTKIYV